MLLKFLNEFKCTPESTKNNFDWKDRIETNTENFEQINESLHNIANLINNPVEDRTEDSINE